MELVDIKSSTCIEFNKENSKGDTKFELGKHLGISKCKSMIVEGYTPN